MTVGVVMVVRDEQGAHQGEGELLPHQVGLISQIFAGRGGWRRSDIKTFGKP